VRTRALTAVAALVAYLAVVMAVAASAGAGGARAAPAGHLAQATPVTALEIVYSSNFFGAARLHYRLTCNPAGGTLARAVAACAAIGREPWIIPGAAQPPHGVCESVRDGPVPSPSFSVTVKGEYRGSAVDPEACFDERSWLRLLPSRGQLTKVLIDRGLGPLRLGQSEASVHALLGEPEKTRHGLQIYAESGSVQQVTGAPGVPAIFAVGFDRAGRVDTLLDNSFRLRVRGESATTTPRAGSRLRSWRSYGCAGLHVLANRRPVRGRAATMILPLASLIPTAVVSSDPQSACAAAAATAPAPVPIPPA